jgi:hypothetical protein
MGALLSLSGDTPCDRMFIHYGYASDVSKFAGGLNPNAYATQGPIMTGLEAQQLLALPHELPPNSYYRVVVPNDVAAIGPLPVQPTTVPLRTGGGIEFKFPNGTPPGSVAGPYPLPVK